jgi:ribosomal RNA-processing protein 8
MGTDYGSFIEEAMRVLKAKGWLWIAEVQSRCLDDHGNNLIHALIRSIEALGFDLKSKTIDQNSHFFTIVLQKRKNTKRKSVDVEWPVLKACTYKKR